MEIYPTIISENDQVSRAERLIFECIARSESKEGYVAYHSLPLPDHPTKYVGETDFVILTPRGLLVIEVKGGVVVLENRCWKLASPGQKPRNIESPFRQASGNMYALRKKIEKAKLPLKYKHNLMGYGVIFPECKFEQDGPDMEQEVLFDARILRKKDPMRFVISSLEKEFDGRIRNGATKLPRKDWLKMEKWFRPRYQSLQSLRAEQQILQRKRITLTKSQMDFLETASGKNRIICQGGAGTGKTLLGLEFARIKSLKRRGVAMIVPGNLLRYLRGKGYREEWLISYQQLSEKSDASVEWLVVDEAQDLMNLDDFAEIDRVLQGGLGKGNWLFLIDHQNQYGVRGKFDPEWMQTIQDYSEADLILPRNVRNTKKIIRSTHELTGRDIGKKGTGKGPETEWIRYAEVEERDRLVKQKVNQLIESNLEPGEIVIVGVEEIPKNDSLAKGLSDLGVPITVFKDGDLGKYPFTMPGYATPAQIKGIEAYCIIIDLGDFGVARLSEPSFYVAITRATGRLIMVIPREMAAEVGAIMNDNIPLEL